MRQISFIYESKDQLLGVINENNLLEDNLMILLFSDENSEKSKSIASDIRELLPKSLLAGTSSAGLINQDQVLENKSLVIILEFEKIRVKGVLLPEEGLEIKESAERLVDSICSEDTKLVFLFVDGYYDMPNKLLDHLTELIPDIPIAGGKAGTPYPEHYKTFIFLNEGFIEKGIVAISLSGDYLRIFQNQHFNWKKIGSGMRITEAEGNLVSSINNEPIAEIYDRYLGEEYLEKDQDFAKLGFPLLLNRNGVEMARSFARKMPDGSLLYYGDIKKGEEVHFGYGHVPSIIEDAHNRRLDAKEFQPEGIISFSCFTRRVLMGEDTKLEIEPYSHIAPVAGFFTFGEFFHKNRENHFLNTTLINLMLSEKEIDRDKLLNYEPTEEREINYSRQSAISKTLIHLVEEVSKELEDKNLLLKNLSITDSVTGLYNHRYFWQVLNQETEKALRYKKNLTIAFIDLDDFKDVNDNYGHQVGDQVLIGVADRIRGSCRKTDSVFRYGGDEFVVIFSETNLEGARNVMERVRKNISSLSFPDYDIRITASIGISQLESGNPKKLLERANKFLYKAKQSGKNSISYF